MARTIDNQTISTKALCAFLGVKVEAFKNWREREGLLPDRSPGTGRSAEWSFSACLVAYIAVEAMRRGRSVRAAVKIAHEADALSAFMAGRPVNLTLLAPEAEPGPDALSLEDFGRELADWFCHHIAATLDPVTGCYAGPRAYIEAKAHFEAQLERCRK